MKKRLKKKLNVFFGLAIFVFLVGSAFAINWIFGVGFVLSFALAVYNKILEKKPLIPIFIFIGAFIISFALNKFVPRIINAEDYYSLGISLILFLIILFIGWRVKTGKFRF